MNHPLVLADCHHLSLFNSLDFLFHDRLGGELFRPIGLEWFKQGYWRMAEIYNNSPETIEQYLGIRPDYIPKDGSMPLNRVQTFEDDVYTIWDPEYGFFHIGITLEKFFAMPFDIVIASIPQHIESFQRLCDKHPNHPKLIYQVGNNWTIEQGKAKNIMASAKIANVPPETNYVEYHQESGADFDYKEKTQLPEKNIYSFINCFNTADHYKEDWQLFLELERLMPEYKFLSMGGSCRDGTMDNAEALSSKMREAMFGLHIKKFGDGFGHNIFNFFKIGTPPIVRKSDYIGKLAEPLIIDGETCITIDDKSLEQIIKEIEHFSKPENYFKMSYNAGQKFLSVVDYHQEELLIRQFIDKLV